MKTPTTKKKLAPLTITLHFVQKTTLEVPFDQTDFNQAAAKWRIGGLNYTELVDILAGNKPDKPIIVGAWGGRDYEKVIYARDFFEECVFPTLEGGDDSCEYEDYSRTPMSTPYTRNSSC